MYQIISEVACMQDLSTLPDEKTQELLFIEFLQQIVERVRTPPSSPYLHERARHMRIATKLLTYKSSVKLEPKSPDELQDCVNKLSAKAQEIVQQGKQNVSDSLFQAAQKLHNQPDIDAVIDFGRVYYVSCLDGLTIADYNGLS